MAKLVSERISIGDFFKGLAYVHVDYATREYSRCYRWGENTGCAMFIAAPVAFVFGLGVAVGAWIW